MEEISKDWTNKLYMLHENAKWLGECAGEGLKLKSFDKSTASFEEGEPQKLEYKIVILEEDGNPFSQIRIIERQGFTLVCNFKEYYVFYIDAKYGHIEPRLQEASLEYAKRWFNRQMLRRVGGSIIALVLFTISLLMQMDEIILWILDMSMFYEGIHFILALTVCASALNEYQSIINSKRFLLNHEKYVVKTNLINNFFRRKGIIALAVLVLGASFIYSVYFDKSDVKLPIAEIEKTMPVVLLQAVVQDDEEVTPLLDKLQKTASDENYGEVKKAIFAPKQYYMSQSYGNRLITTYYEIAIEDLAGALAYELETEKPWGIEKEQIEEITIKGLDKAYMYTDGMNIHVSASKGKKVMYISYSGDKTAEYILQEMAKVM